MSEMVEPEFSYRATAVLASPFWFDEEGMGQEFTPEWHDGRRKLKDRMETAVHRARRYGDLSLADRMLFDQVEVYNTNLRSEDAPLPEARAIPQKDGRGGRSEQEA